MRYTLISSEFHNKRRLSQHRTLSGVARAALRYSRTHGECCCEGASIVIAATPHEPACTMPAPGPEWYDLASAMVEIHDYIAMAKRAHSDGAA